jgi:quinol monooxygenase YgiN
MTQEMVEVKQFSGCEKFRLYADVTNENTFLLYEEWQSQTNFDTYKNSDYFKQNGEKLFPMMAEPPDTAYFEAEILQ